MMTSPLSRILSVLGSIFILCGIIALLVVGIKARNLFFAGLASGLAAWALSWLSNNKRVSPWAGFGLSLGMAFLYGQRAMANLLALIGIIQHDMPLDAYNKCITVVLLMIMSMASVSAMLFMFAFMPESQKD